MKLITTQGDLAHALRTVAPAIGAGTSHPILNCCLVTAADGVMTVTGFNLELGISVSVPAAVETPGTVALPHRLPSLIALRPPRPSGSSNQFPTQNFRKRFESSVS